MEKIKQTAFKLTEGEIRRLDSKARGLGVNRTTFIKILINSGEVTSSYTVDEKITSDYTDKVVSKVTRVTERVIPEPPEYDPDELDKLTDPTSPKNLKILRKVIGRRVTEPPKFKNRLEEQKAKWDKAGELNRNIKFE